jgi:hypothetical protein
MDGSIDGWMQLIDRWVDDWIDGWGVWIDNYMGGWINKIASQEWISDDYNKYLDAT